MDRELIEQRRQEVLAQRRESERAAKETFTAPRMDPTPAPLSPPPTHPEDKIRRVDAGIASLPAFIPRPRRGSDIPNVIRMKADEDTSARITKSLMRFGYDTTVVPDASLDGDPGSARWESCGLSDRRMGHAIKAAMTIYRKIKR